ncbi:hypothetical protein O3P69_020223 [Scylla paramamosain]|uniref:Uncharacterized protein n=1 Tax=Scylla paramamosain TaxID=85552 RepID=A0AAW0TKD0_SCYPA
MIEDIQNQRQPPAQGTETSMYIHSKAVSDGQVHYHCQKSSLLNATSSSQPLDDEEHVSHPLSVLQASGHWQLSEEPIGPVDLQRAFMRHLSLLAKKRRKRCTDSDKQELAQHSGRTSKRQKVESSRLSSECSTSDQNLSITICNQIRRPINIRITLCCSPKSDGNASTDQHSVIGGGGGWDDPDEQRQSMESPKVSTPHRSPPSARKRKCFENDSS